jgi:hypothetical protein
MPIPKYSFSLFMKVVYNDSKTCNLSLKNVVEFLYKQLNQNYVVERFGYGKEGMYNFDTLMKLAVYYNDGHFANELWLNMKPKFKNLWVKNPKHFKDLQKLFQKSAFNSIHTHNFFRIEKLPFCCNLCVFLDDIGLFSSF